MKYLTTSDLARAVGIHPNTVRRYAAWGLLPPVQRAKNGYRQFTQQHLDCLRVAHAVYFAPFANRAIRQSGSRIVECAVVDDWGGALERAHAHLTLVRSEQAQAESAALLLERWAAGALGERTGTAAETMSIGQVARLLDISIDVLRNWERNGFIDVPRDAGNGYRIYGPNEISRLRVIRMLTRAGYSQMALLRMLLQLERGNTTNLRHLLDTPAPDEDVYTASDRWLSALAEQEQIALHIIALVEEIMRQRATRKPSRP